MKKLWGSFALLLLLPACQQVQETSVARIIASAPTSVIPTSSSCESYNLYSSLVNNGAVVGCQDATLAKCDLVQQSMGNSQMAYCYKPRAGFETCAQNPANWQYTPWSAVQFEQLSTNMNSGTFMKYRSLIACSRTVCLCTAPVSLSSNMGGGYIWDVTSTSPNSSPIKKGDQMGAYSEVGTALANQSDPSSAYYFYKFKTPTTITSSTMNYADAGVADVASWPKELHESWTPQFSNLVAYWPMVEDTSAPISAPVRTLLSGKKLNGDPIGVNLSSFQWNGLTVGLSTHLSQTAIVGSHSLWMQSANGAPPFAGQYDGLLNKSLSKFTVSFWAKRSSTACKGPDANGMGDPLGFFIGVEAGVFHFGTGADCSIWVGIDSVSSGKMIHTPKGLMSTYWKLFTFTYESGVGKLFINGVLAYTKSGMSTPTSFGTFSIGGYDLMTGITGYIDDAAIWNVALSDQEVAAIFNRQTAPTPKEAIQVADLPSNSSPAGNDPNQPFRIKGLSIKTKYPYGKELPVDSESSTSYSGISPNSTVVNSTLSDGLVALWNFNETVPNMAPNGADFKDAVGQAHARRKNAVVMGVPSPLGQGVGLRGNEFIYVPAAQAASIPTGSDARSFAGWIQTSRFPGTNERIPILGYGNTCGACAGSIPNTCATVEQIICDYPTGSTGPGGFLIEIVDGAPGSTNGQSPELKVINIVNGSPSVISSVSLATDVYLGKWFHFAVTINTTGNASIYINGQLANSGTISPLNTSPNTNFLIGGYRSLGKQSRFNGNIDSLGVWNKPLSASEVEKLYARGASRALFQIRTCSNPTVVSGALTCPDATPWKGPDGTAATWYSEEFNRATSFNSASNVNASHLDLDLRSIPGQPPAGSHVQIKARYEILTSHDSANGLDALVKPQNVVATITPESFYGGFTTVQVDESKQFLIGAGANNALVSTRVPYSFSGGLTPLAFGEQLGPSGCAAGVTYQLGVIPSGSLNPTWMYWTGSTWTTANQTTPTVAQSNPASVISANLPALGAVAPAGELVWRAFLKSDSTQDCQLKSVNMLVQ
jgi:hypothetical protein